MTTFAREPKLRRVSLWIVAFVINLGLQVFRASSEDTIIFAVFTLVLIFASYTKKNSAWLLKLDFPYIVESAILFAFILAISPWHSVFLGVVFVALLFVVVALIWSRTQTERMPRTKRMKRAELIWVSLAVGLALWEFGANILGIQDDSTYNYPTISVLVDPMLDSHTGKVIFAALYVALGLGLLRLVRRR